MAVIIGLILGPLPTGADWVAPLAYIAPFTLYEFLTSGLEEPGWRMQFFWQEESSEAQVAVSSETAV